MFSGSFLVMIRFKKVSSPDFIQEWKCLDQSRGLLT